MPYKHQPVRQQTADSDIGQESGECDTGVLI